MSDSVKRAVEKYSRSRLEPKDKTPTRKNKKPEEDTNSDLKTWFKDHDWSMHRVESKGVYSARLERYVKSDTEVGFSDWAGCVSSGLGAFIESKAKGKRSNLSMKQREFLIAKIKRGAFACVVDSAPYLNDLVNKYRILKTRSDRIYFLLQDLPKLQIDDSDLF